MSLKKKQTRENPAASHEKMKGETTSRLLLLLLVQKRKILGVCQEIKTNEKKAKEKKWNDKLMEREERGKIREETGVESWKRITQKTTKRE